MRTTVSPGFPWRNRACRSGRRGGRAPPSSRARGDAASPLRPRARHSGRADGRRGAARRRPRARPLACRVWRKLMRVRALNRRAKDPRSPWLAVIVAAALLGPATRPAGASGSPDLRSCADPALQTGLERVITRLGLDGTVAGRTLAVALVDLSTAGAPRLAMLNGDEMMYAASLPKIAILLGAFVQAERGRLVLDEPTLAALHRMIRSSSNTDASAMLAKVGEDQLPRSGHRRGALGGQGVGEGARLPARSPPRPLAQGHRVPGGPLLLRARPGRARLARAHAPDEGRALGARHPAQVRQGPRVEAGRPPLPEVRDVEAVPLGQSARRGTAPPLHPGRARRGPEGRPPQLLRGYG
jgi:hypothetical protein